MNHEYQHRAAQHHRLVARQGALKVPDALVPDALVPDPLDPDLKDPKVIPTIRHRPVLPTTTIVPPKPVVTPKPTIVKPPPGRPVVPTTTALPTTPLPVVQITPSLPVVPTTTSLKPSVVTTISSTTSVKPKTSAAPISAHRNVPTTTSSTLPSPSKSPEAASGATSTGALVGGIGGGIVGGAIFIFLLVVIVRRWRKRVADRDAFNATTFRRSALMLSDPPTDHTKPRPPTMIERRMANPSVPTPPPVSYLYDDQPQYGNNQYSQYGTTTLNSGHPSPNNYTGDRFGAGYDAYGQSAVTYGAYGAPPTHTPHPQYPQQQQAYPQQYSFSPGQVIPPPRASPPSPASVNLPNPFDPAATGAAAALASARRAAESSATAPQGTAPTQLHSSTYLNRQPTQAGGAPPAYKDEGGYTNMQRDVKIAPPVVMNVSSSEGSRPAPPVSGGTSEANKRPLSSYTIYDPEDAYGGI